MKRVVCKDETYKELYDSERYKYVRLFEYEDLVGFHGIDVLLHEGECSVDLEQALIVLSKFGYITLVYVERETGFFSFKCFHVMRWRYILW